MGWIREDDEVAALEVAGPRLEDEGGTQQLMNPMPDILSRAQLGRDEKYPAR